MKAWRFEVASFEADTFDIYHWDTRIDTLHLDEIRLLNEEIISSFYGHYNNFPNNDGELT